MTTRTVGWLADTNVLICYGSMNGGRAHFRAAFAGGVAVSPAIRAEIQRKHSRLGTAECLKRALDAFIGRFHETVLDVPFESRDEPERDRALRYFRDGGALPREPYPAKQVLELEAASGTSDVGEHGGEAEIVAIALRRGLPILTNDRAAVRFARHRSINVESFAESLRRLVPGVKPQDVFNLWREVNRHHDTGVVVPGSQFFRVPPPAPAPAPGMDRSQSE